MIDRALARAANGKEIVQCVCTANERDAEEQGRLHYYDPLTDDSAGRDPHRMWIYGESCKCGGTGWVCQKCHGSGWIRTYKGDAKHCPQCSHDDGAGHWTQDTYRPQQVEREPMRQYEYA